MKQFAHLLIACAFAMPAIAQTAPTLVNSAFDTGYIPEGFDTNDRIEMVAEGVFPNTCFRPASVRVDVNHDTKTIEVGSAAYHYDGFCLQMLLPFDQTIELGLLQNGTYQVRQKVVSGPESFLGEVKVKSATNSGADDFLYAPINQAFFEQDGSKSVLKLSGEFTSSCMRLADVMVSVQPKVVVVQPIAEVATAPGVRCVDGKFPFQKTVEIKDVKNGRYLIHVRSMNGKSVNSLVDVM